MLKELVRQCRSYRRFYEDVLLCREELEGFVDTARLAGSAANLQALKFKVVTDEKEKEAVFPTLRWAAALKDWDGPQPGERPGGYIIIVGDLDIAKNRSTDVGINAQMIVLAAAEQGYGGCMIGSFDRNQLAEVLQIDQERYSLELVLALGKPKEEVRMVAVQDGRTTYYRDCNQVHYVPKRELKDILL